MMAFDEEDRRVGRILSFLHAGAYLNEKQGELGEELIYDAPFLISKISACSSRFDRKDRQGG